MTATICRRYSYCNLNTTRLHGNSTFNMTLACNGISHNCTRNVKNETFYQNLKITGGKYKKFECKTV